MGGIPSYNRWPSSRVKPLSEAASVEVEWFSAAVQCKAALYAVRGYQCHVCELAALDEPPT